MLDGVLYVIVGLLLLVSYMTDKEKTKKALMKAWKSLLKNIKLMVGMMILMGIIFVLVSPDAIGQLFGKESGLLGIVIGLILGSISFMPSFIAFPLGAGLIENGAGYPQVAGFISSLMGVGIISLGMEVEYFGKKASLMRNAFAVVASIIFVIVIGGVM